MTISRRHLLASLPALGLVHTGGAHAEEFTRPLRIVVPYPAGGSADTLARQLSTQLTETLKQSVIVDNRPGGNSAVAVNFVASQPADGHTLLVIDPAQFVLNPLIYKKLPYDPAQFEPVAQLQRLSFIMQVNPNHPAKTLKEFVAWAKARPNGVSYATGGAGTNPHLWMEKFTAQQGLRGVHTPYRGAAPAHVDLMGGQVDVMVGDVGSALQHVKAGKIRVLGVLSPSRHPLLPDVPTFTESGFPDLQMEAWHGIAVRRGASPALLQKLNASLVAAVAEPRITESIRSTGATPAPALSAQDFARLMQNDIRTWEPVAKAFNIVLE